MQTHLSTTNGVAKPTVALIREIYGGEIYEYYPLGQYIVAAPGVCGGRPTFKYTRLGATMILALLGNGETIEEIVEDYHLSNLTPDAVREAIQLASMALLQSTQALQLALA